MDNTDSNVATPSVEEFLNRYERRELLRFLTCGSVDDGKSTLIGRLLHDSQMVYDDQLAAVRRDTTRHGTTGEEIDFALLVDGLEAEREQGITIDVAYRYFSTPRRKFIIADTPGHEQYTRNMATGASTCNLAVILVDARKGVLDQTRRHAFITSLLGITHMVVAINKMDLVDYSEERFEAIRADFTDFAAKLRATDVEFIPVSALRGENIVHPGPSMPWYRGRPLLDHLESVYIASDVNLIDLRFPVQFVLRPNLDFRGYAGTLASGVIRRGDDLVVLPSGRPARVSAVLVAGQEVDEAQAPMAVAVTLEGETDVSRGDMLVRPNNVPQLTHTLEAMVVWMDEQPLQADREYLLKQTSVLTSAHVSRLLHKVNVNTIHREDADALHLNEIGRVTIETPRLLAVDAYDRNRATGSFILIDRITNATVGAGMVVEQETLESVTGRRVAPDAATNIRRKTKRKITSQERAQRLDQSPLVVWLTGLPRSGKSSLAYALERRLFDEGLFPHVIDGEELRTGLSSDLGFSAEDRREQARRTAELARTLADLGLIVIVATVSPFAADRAAAREMVGEHRFLEVYCSAPLDVCEARDEERLFARARAGEVVNVTGLDLPYEPPQSPDLDVLIQDENVDSQVARVVELLRSKGLIRSN